MELRDQPAIVVLLATALIYADATRTARAAPQPRGADIGQAGRAIIYVDDDNTSGPWDGTFEHPYQYIQDGIDNAAPRDTVMVLAGTYLENVIVDRSVMLLGEDVESTIIDAGGIAEAVYVAADGVTVSGFSMTGADGLAAIVLASDGNMIMGNHLTENNEVYWGAIYLTGSSYNDICDNRITYTDREAAIWLNWASCWNTISRNTISNNGFCGVTIWHESSHNKITENTFSANRNGIWVEDSSHNTFTANTFVGNEFEGIDIWDSSFLAINNNVFGRGGGLTISSGYEKAHWSTHTIEGNTVSGAPVLYFKDAQGVSVPSDAAQVILGNCESCTITGLDTRDSLAPVQMGFCAHCTVNDNDIAIDWYSDAIVMRNCTYVDIIGNRISSSYDQYDYSPAVNIAAIKVRDGGENTYQGNTIQGFNQGILIRRWNDSFDNLITENDIASKLIGVWLIEHGGDGTSILISDNTFANCPLAAVNIASWPGVTLVSNTMTGCSLVISGEELADWNTHTVAGNVVNGQELVYRTNQTHFSVEDNAGQVVLANCHDFELLHLHMSEGSAGVMGGFCSTGRIADCRLTDFGDAAIYFQASDDIQIMQNRASGGGHGIRMDGGDSHAITDNNVVGGANNGISVSNLTNSVISGNIVSEMEGVGIACSRLSECTILENVVLCSGTTGISLGNSSTANSLSGNTLSRNGTYGMVLASESTNNQIESNQFVENTLLNAREVYNSNGNIWNGPEGGNFWSDFEQNPGYPDYYEIDGDGDGVDWAPLDSVSGCPFGCGDIDGSCGEVDFADFEAFVECWDVWPADCGDYGCSDFDGDGGVDLHDFAAFSLLFGPA
jgi:parallel beta-helix repeat protein